MRVGGRFPAIGAADDANIRNAEALFETRTVAEIREVESRTRREIEEKKEELRQLVGASYRDLIESADSIVLMKKSCEAVADNIRKMENGFESLKRTIVVQRTSAEADQERSRREQLYGTASRLKFLVDTPEKIWGCLDKHMYLEGSERYWRAREVHALLSEEKTELLANCPLLKQRGPLVESLRDQISKRSRERLQEPGLQVAEYAVALAAVATTDELTSGQVFSLFLETRRSWIRSQLRTAFAGRDRLVRDKGTGGADLVPVLEVAAVSALLHRLVFMIQSSLCHVGELFLEVSNGKAPLLFSTVLTSPPASQLFGGIPNPEKEVRLWKAHRDKVESCMVPLSSEQISQACVSWLGACAEEISVEGKPLLEEIKSISELADIEKSIREDLETHAAMDATLDWLKSAFGKDIDSPWDRVCDLLLNQPVNIWTAIFEKVFVRRAKGIITLKFGEISVGTKLDECLAAVKSSSSLVQYLSLESPYALQGGAFSSFQDSQTMKGLEASVGLGNLTGGDPLWKSSKDVKDLSDSMNFWYGQDVAGVKDTIDGGLHKILEDTATFLQGPETSARMTELAPFLQEQCHKCVASVVSEISTRLTSLAESKKRASESSNRVLSDVNVNTEGRSSKNVTKQPLVSLKDSESAVPDVGDVSLIVERSLFLGRLAAALARNSSALCVILGPPALWISRETTSSNSRGTLLSWRQHPWLDSEPQGTGRRLHTRRAGAGGEDEGSLKLAHLQRSLRRQSIAAHEIWISWSTEELVTCLKRDLFKDECLATTHPLKGWEETVLKQKEEGGGFVEMQMALPAMPSAYAVASLFAACQEIRRIGGHMLDRVILRMFAWRLCEHVFSLYESIVDDTSSSRIQISEKGLLQILFDVRFFGDVLSGGQNIKAEDMEASEGDRGSEPLGTGSNVRRSQAHSLSDASASARKKWAVKLASKLHSRLDPIDWATYEPHLWENERRFYQRSAVLFGLLMQLNRLYKDNVQRPPSSSEGNVLNMSATVPRFTYLPVSGPNLSTNGSSTPSRPRRREEDTSWLRPYGSGGDASAFQFEDSPASASNAKNFQNFMTQMGSSTLKLGSILTDGQVGRLKDTFGEISMPNLFSSLTASASKSEA